MNSKSGSERHSQSYQAVVRMLDRTQDPIYGSLVEDSDSFGI